ncbi:MAG: YhdH/YhfP family quinone oxidoreductase [Thermodesulfobacteriota bacterium]|nr:YhdH/YhfP family quinone oxidoreductase [Thermodesulfobacteriota bacterium]
METTFSAYQVKKIDDKFIGKVERLKISDLPQGDVLIKVTCSSFNYKDGLSATGNPGVTRKYPHIPGIDAAGVVVESASSGFKPGDEILITGYDLGMDTDGGFAQYCRVPSDWVVPLPKGLSLKEAMLFGTAGFTAALCVNHLIHNRVTPENGPVLVTGASGGVGSVAVSILAKLGYDVTASSGKKDQYEFLKKIGAGEVISRQDVQEDSNRPFLKPQWAGVVETVGGKTMEYVLRTTKYMGSVASCGLVGGANFATTVFPFIIRGVSLLGVDSVQCPMGLRLKIWNKLSCSWKPDTLDLLSSTIDLDGIDAAVKDILNGKIKGRTLVEPKSQLD